MISRSYLIPVYSNLGKQESIRYTAARFVQFVQHFVNKFFYDQISKSSTKGMGTLANQAQRKAVGIVRAQKAASEATGNKSSCPEIKFKSCPAKIEVSEEDSSYDYWILVQQQLTTKRFDNIEIPARSIRPLNKALKHGWKLNETCELVFKGRAIIRAREEGVRVVLVNPAYSSQTCSSCGTIDKRSRAGEDFHCTACGHVAHADLNAANNLAIWASVRGTKERNPCELDSVLQTSFPSKKAAIETYLIKALA